MAFSAFHPMIKR